MKIASQAQLKMFETCVADPDYAKSRGVAVDLAKQFLDAHKAAGSPKLPVRTPVAAPAVRDAQQEQASPVLLQSMRED